MTYYHQTVTSQSLQSISAETKAFLAKLREKAVIALVGGSDLHKIEEQMDGVCPSRDVMSRFSAMFTAMNQNHSSISNN